VVLTGGGTGGHVFPLRAIAESLLEGDLEADDLVVVGARHGQEAALLADLGVELVLLPGRGLRRDLGPAAWWANARAVVGLAVAFVRGVALVASRRPSAVVSVGGYAAFAAAAGAVVTARPLVLVDLDATPGLVHRVLRPFAVAIAAAFPGDPRAVVTGAPVREGIAALRRTDDERTAARARLALDDDATVVAVVTGSLGAWSVNDAVCALAVRWRDRGATVLYHVTGRRDAERVAARRADAGIAADRWRLVDFESSMADLYAACDVAVTRAGATTVAELCAAGVPAVVVPLPGAPGDHQRHNADVLVGAGAAVALDDAALCADALGDTLEALLARPDRLAELSAAAHALARPDAARRIAEVVCDRAR
jgi:UDP-N-acetylglucosamine--N-acetylmuramyl-(pentapeptide) pyrophosphoryl-undecaprenol N-acetylglucosamine transferase